MFQTLIAQAIIFHSEK